MSHKDIVECRTLRTSEELLCELSPATGSLWRVNKHIDRPRTEWLFRGQSNDANGRYWSLKPTAHRGANAFLPFTESMVKLRQKIGVELRKMESAFVVQFANRVDKHGFVVPSDSHELRDSRLMRSPRWDGKEPWDDPKHFPPAHLIAMFGLAQHHGIPTRLLDWTVKPLTAAYFAALPVAKRRAPGSKLPAKECPHFSVFAVHRWASQMCAGLDPEIHFLTVPTATNTNLYAQGWQFSLVQPLSDPKNQPLPAIDKVLQKHSEAIRKLDNGHWCHLFPLLVEFRVPVREARTTLMTLATMGVTAASVFPGLQGVADSLREDRYYQWAPPDDRKER